MKDVAHCMINFAKVRTNENCPNDYLNTLPIVLLLMESAEQSLLRAVK